MKKSNIQSLTQLGLIVLLGGAIFFGSGGGTAAASSSKLSAASCTFSTWTANTNYPVGTIVQFPDNGSFYQEVKAAPDSTGSAGADPDATNIWQPVICSTATPAPTRQVGSYYTSWSSKNGFRLMHLDRAGLAAKFTYLNYAFENIYPMADGTFQCGNGEDRPDVTDGASPVPHSLGQGMNASLDYGKLFGANESVDGTADTADQPIAGNFNQIRQLKAKNPNLHVMVALGGWSWSRYFSAAVATDSLRKTLVASCINVHIKGNLPMFNGHGGTAAAAGVFDGIDIDWEFPGGGGEKYNTFSADDKHNFTLMLAEFRQQLDALTAQTGKKYYLTSAMNSARGAVDNTEPALYSRYVDWINLMTYDFHGNWEKTGPANFQSNLYSDPGSPDGGAQSIDSAVHYLTSVGVPANKIVVGVPFYARGWEGVPAANNGLYQAAGQPAPGVEIGVHYFSSMAGLDFPKFYHPVTQQLWAYKKGTFWTYDDPIVIRTKAAYVIDKGLGGMMSWALDQDDAAFTLSSEMVKVR